ncbi:hypothetical protein BJ973_001913 [Actinoplanes tereljensis]|uniref:Uncharacterized protein n=1 Tax=Paractinoplanes tereljensis TaxID=571912 RepID=A0A919TTA3_9ACTN|nr:hypothetical protein [Actinoplanes tereljensis]GIF20180.1 hypothetical protein Ate02nite_29100 [Actinoplanes tereljensis]
MSQPRATTMTPESTIFDLLEWDLLVLTVGSTDGEDGGGSHSPAEFGTGDDQPAEADTGTDEPDETTTGEDGGGSHTPPAETDDKIG